MVTQLRRAAAAPILPLVLLMAACSPASESAGTEKIRLEDFVEGKVPGAAGPAETASAEPEAMAAGSIPSAPAQPAPAAKATKGYSITTPLRVLFDDPAAKAVLQTHAPRLVQFGPQIPQMMDESLKSLAANPRMGGRDGLSSELLARIDADLGAL